MTLSSKLTAASRRCRFPMRPDGSTGSGEDSWGPAQPDGQQRQSVEVQCLRLRSAQTGVDLVQRGRAGAQRLLIQRVERRLDGVEMGVQVFRFRIDIQEPGDDLTLGGMLLQEVLRAETIMRIV